MQKLILAVILGLLTGSLCGCGDGGLNDEPSQTNTPAEYFDKHQRDTMTPHGPIKDGSFVDTPDGNVQYETENGEKFGGVPVSTDNGGYRLTEVEQVP